ncbi:hypothetical protein [Flavobacterium aciduliphilum]|uniref:Subunit length determinant protein n=1 Tax=Flavobacterium aciduliphilum TaxID=1101402 RepID=A0A328YJD8_9FLAO|nr:hypothetical protein [Flavobacterium aciduliphilum]RAR72895.1 hypothetical protein CLV55_104156 [Flavobacterium aciduliphilum]
MNTEQQHNNISEEIDLGMLKRSISNAISKSILNTFLFFKKNIYKFLFLIVLGITLGVIADNYAKSYLSEVVVNTNFTSNDYLYSKVDLLNSQLNQTKKELPISNYKKFIKIEVEPIIDVYAFVNNQAVANNAQNSQNFEMLKLMSETGDINKIIKDQVTSKNYYYQKINIFSKSKVEEKDIKSVIQYLNRDTYFDSILHLNIKNIKERISKNDSTIKQINDLIQSYTISISRGNASVMFKNENSELNNLINQKNELIKRVEYDKENLITKNKIIRDNTIVYNQTNNRGISNKLKFILPLLFVLLFLCGNYIIYLNKKSKNIS